MRIYAFKGKGLEPWVPSKVSICGNTHHNLKIGCFNKGYWGYIIGIDDAMVDLYNPPKPLEGELFLTGLNTRGKNSKPLIDKLGNKLFYVKEVVGYCSIKECMLGLTLTSKSILDIEIINDEGIIRLASYSLKFLGKEKFLHVYIFKEGDILEFKLTTKKEVRTIIIAMNNNKLIQN